MKKDKTKTSPSHTHEQTLLSLKWFHFQLDISETGWMPYDYHQMFLICEYFLLHEALSLSSVFHQSSRESDANLSFTLRMYCTALCNTNATLQYKSLREDSTEW